MKLAGKSDLMAKGPDKGGYPDMGNGVYADKLTYEQWFHFNVRQRAYLNFLEVLCPTVVLLLIAGLSTAWVSIGSGIAIFIGRLLYVIGYSSGNVRWRGPGLILSNSGFMTLVIMSIISIAKMLYVMNN